MDAEIGIANIVVDGDFDTVTEGNGTNYCQETEAQVAEAANVTTNRVDNVECIQGITFSWH